MNIHHVLFFCFISALCGDTGLVSAKISIFTGAEGGSGSITCYISQPKNIKFFCKEECKAEGILIKTEDVRAQNGRFSTEYKRESSGSGVLTVTIRNLTMSDSGRYRSGLGTDLVPDSYCDFDIRVSDELPFGNTSFFHADTEGENITFGCSGTVPGKQMFLCKDECKTEEDIIIETDGNRAQSGRYSIEYEHGSTFGLSVTITNVSKSDTGRYKCGYGRALSPDSSKTFPIIVMGELPDGNTGFVRTNIEGENITFGCSGTVYRKQKFLCKDECKTDEDIIIETNANRAQSGRYSIEYREGSLFGLYVIITNASKSDTGWYKCGYGRALSPDSSHTVPVLVIGDPSEPNQTPPPFSTSVPSASTPTTQSLNLSSRSFTPSSSFPKTANQPSAAVSSSVPHPGYMWGLVVLLMVVVSVLILYIWKMRMDFRSSSRYTEIPFIYRDLDSASTCEDSAVKTCSE